MSARKRQQAGSSLLLRIAGADPDAFAQSMDGVVPPAGDRSRYAVMGLAVCITALFSSCTVPAALTLATGHFSPVFLLYGSLWGLFVFNLDRWVVCSVDYGPLDGAVRWPGRLSQVGRKLAVLTVRLVVAFLIGLSISEPLVMLIYNEEILTEYQQVQLPQLQADTTARVLHDPKYADDYVYQADVLQQANQTVQSDTTLDQQANQALDAEEAGTGGTGRVGVGQRAQERRDDLKQADDALNKAKKARADAQAAYNEAKSSADAQQQRDLTEQLTQISRNPGLLDREQALSALAASKPPIWDAEWVLRGLILLIDLAPMLLKLLSPRSPYERNLRRKVVHDIEIHDEMQVNRVEQALANLAQQNAAAAERRELDSRHRSLTVTQEYRIADEQVLRRADIEIRRAIAYHRAQVEQAGLVTLLDLGIVPYVDPRARLSAEFAVARSGQRGSGLPTSTSEPSAEQTNSEEQADLPTGESIDQLVDQRWRLGRQITGIGMRRGPRTPFLAYDIHDKQRPRQTYAVKCMGQDASAKREIEALPYGEAISPYVTPVVHGGYDRLFGWFVVTPFYRNGTLQQLISADNQELSLGAALTVTLQILMGLQATFTEEHQFLAHFDIKPSNIAFDDNGNVRIIDWGLARATSGAVDESVPDRPHGYTLWYAPAEQIDFSRGGNKTWRGPLCDIRAVGAVVYAMITGHPPLHTEAAWLGLLDEEKVLAKGRREDFIRLLATTKPMPLIEFFAANEGWDAAQLGGLSALVEQWLDPDPAKRVVRSTSAPTYDVALAALRQVVADLRTGGAELMDAPIGADALPQVPRMRPVAVPSPPMRHTAHRDEETVIPREKGTS